MYAWAYVGSRSGRENGSKEDLLPERLQRATLFLRVSRRWAFVVSVPKRLRTSKAKSGLNPVDVEAGRGHSNSCA